MKKIIIYLISFILICFILPAVFTKRPAKTTSEISTIKNVIEAYTRHCFTNKELRPINLKKHNLKYYNEFEKFLKKEQ